MPHERDDEAASNLRTFLSAIHQRYGYDLRDYATGSVTRRVSAAVARWRLSGVKELEERCLAEPAFFADVLDQLTVQVSDLFRDPPFFLALRTRVVPILRTYPRLAVWVCGCATGEEAYSIAILLSEEGLYDRTHIYATDLSPRAIEHAKEGVYRIASLPAYERNYRQAGGTRDLAEYYTAAYNRIALRSSLRRNVSFFQHDLVSDYVFGEMNVILCRNVLIYFAANLQDAVVTKIMKALRPGGFLCLGPSERVSNQNVALFDKFAADERIYRRSLPR